MEKYGTSHISHNFNFRQRDEDMKELGDSDCSEDYDNDPYFQEHWKQTKAIRHKEKE